MPSRLFGRLVVLSLIALPSPLAAGDWPAWRHDAQRTSATADELPTVMHAQWALNLPALTPAWPDQPLMPFDAAYEPVVAGHLMFIGSNRTDSVTAYDTRTGEPRWRFLTDGPVRFAPLLQAGRLYLVSDDGYLYCLDAGSGQLKWKFRGGPSERKILGNGRLISTWPARGAPVIADGTVYFAASIWPFMGVFIHALDAETGRVIWTNDADGSMYIKQPHGADSFAGVAPQGPMAIAGDLLLIPGGRSVPAAYDRQTGKQRHFLLNENSKKGGGHAVAVAGEVFFNGPGVFVAKTGKYLGDASPLTVTAGDFAYAVVGSELRALDVRHAELKPGKWKPDVVGSCKLPGVTAMIKAGNRLVVGMKGKVAMVPLPLPPGTPDDADFAWEAPIDGTPVSLVAAADRLFVSTREGRIHCFGDGEPALTKVGADRPPMLAANGPRTIPIPAQAVVDATRVTEGYAVVWSADVPFLAELIRRTRLHVIAIDPNRDRVQAARNALIAANLYGERCAVHVGEPGFFPLPPYLASLMVAPAVSPDALPTVYESIRPYGGMLFLPIAGKVPDSLRAAVAKLPNAILNPVEGGVIVVRDGALPGSADWTHEHADAANTRVSKDTIVKAPLGVLWFGGTSNEGILPRHGHGPQPQVVGGRIIVEGPDLLRAVDAYTGRLLWETPLPGLGEFYNSTSHQPGANARGTNYISLPDGIYVAYKDACVRLEPATGKRVAEFKFPLVGDDPQSPRLGHLNVAGDYLVLAADPLFTAELEKQARSASKLFKPIDADVFAASRYLAVMDRHTGKLLWTATARVGFRHNTICAGNGKLFAIDRVSGLRLSKLREESDPLPPRVVAWDLATGKQLWHDDTDTFGTWLSYSEKFDVLVESGRVARDTLSDEPKGMRAYRGTDGTELWFDKTALGPAMLHGDTILRGQGACDLLTGKPKMRRDPITGELEEWVWSRNYGCNTPAASEHLMTFRSGAAGFFDLCHDGGTGNFGGFRSSCTNNLVVADGILAAPDYTRTCTCSYQNQCSIAMVPTADAEEWTFYGKNKLEKTIQRVGINLGAPGDRRAPDGTLWLEFPSTGGASPAVPITLTGPKVEYFRRHQSSATGELPWVTSSGVRGIESLSMKLLPISSVEREYTVRLYFAEPDDLKQGDRVFGITIQGRRELADFDIAKEAGGPHKGIVKEFRGVRVTDELRLSFHPSGKRPAILCGVEVVAE
jgi:outer membrane protein assembly factor BamB